MGGLYSAMTSLILLCLVAFIPQQPANQITLILGRDDIQCTSDNPFPCQQVVSMDESLARTGLSRLEKITNPTREEIKLRAALNLSLGVKDAVREPQFEGDPVKRGVRVPLQRSGQ